MVMLFFQVAQEINTELVQPNYMKIHLTDIAIPRAILLAWLCLKKQKLLVVCLTMRWYKHGI